jgi:hypothetical protein
MPPRSFVMNIRVMTSSRRTTTRAKPSASRERAAIGGLCGPDGCHRPPYLAPAF